jgi:hypothetical protein
MDARIRLSSVANQRLDVKREPRSFRAGGVGRGRLGWKMSDSWQISLRKRVDMGKIGWVFLSTAPLTSHLRGISYQTVWRGGLGIEHTGRASRASCVVGLQRPLRGEQSSLDPFGVPLLRRYFPY